MIQKKKKNTIPNTVYNESCKHFIKHIHHKIDKISHMHTTNIITQGKKILKTIMKRNLSAIIERTIT